MTDHRSITKTEQALIDAAKSLESSFRAEMYMIRNNVNHDRCRAMAFLLRDKWGERLDEARMKFADRWAGAINSIPGEIEELEERAQ